MLQFSRLYPLQRHGVRSFVASGLKMARPKRFELLTPRFVVWCSIQLSYGRVFRMAIMGRDAPVSQHQDMPAKAGHS